MPVQQFKVIVGVVAFIILWVRMKRTVERPPVGRLLVVFGTYGMAWLGLAHGPGFLAALTAGPLAMWGVSCATQRDRAESRYHLWIDRAAKLYIGAAALVWAIGLTVGMLWSVR